MPDLSWLFTWANIRFLLGGLGMTLAVAGLSIVLSSIFGLLLALARISRSAIVRYPAIAYIEIMRALPILLVIFFTYFALPQIGIRLSPFVAGVTAMSAFTASLVAEIVRAGILSVNRGLIEAAHAQGLTQTQTMRLVILPIALRRMMPALVSQFITLIKDTSLTAVIGILELVRRAQIIYSGPPFQPIPVFILVALIYFVVNYGLSLGSRRLEQAV
jgi:putative glutamine transport system permease protein